MDKDAEILRERIKKTIMIYIMRHVWLKKVNGANK